MRVNEIFYSIQGEGAHTGMPAVFLRLSGCNLKCSFCDTNHVPFTVMTEEQIVERACQYPTRNIVITGGEPTMQLTVSLLDDLHKEGFAVHIETNGTQPLPDGANPDWVTCSPKGDILIQRIDELKVVYWGQDISHYEGIHVKELRMQPLDTGDTQRNEEIIHKTLEYILKHPIWKLSLQTQKILNVR